MADPGYDFFATGRPVGQPEIPTLPPSASGQAPEPGIVAAPSRFGTPPPGVQPAPPAFSVPAISGYNPGAVNQFGTPLDLQAAPTGPYAAPGVAATPTTAPGLVSTWGESTFGAPAPRPSRAMLAPSVPSGVRTAGIIGIVQGAIVAVIAALALLAYLALKSQVDELANTPEFAGSPGLVQGVTTMVLVGVVYLAAMGAVYLAAGIAAVRGKRWGAWALLIVSVLQVLNSIYQFITGAGGLSVMLNVAISGAVVYLLLTAEAQGWLRSR